MVIATLTTKDSHLGSALLGNEVRARDGFARFDRLSIIGKLDKNFTLRFTTFITDTVVVSEDGKRHDHRLRSGAATRRV